MLRSFDSVARLMLFATAALLIASCASGDQKKRFESWSAADKYAVARDSLMNLPSGSIRLNRTSLALTDQQLFGTH